MRIDQVRNISFFSCASWQAAATRTIQDLFYSRAYDLCGTVSNKKKHVYT